MAGLPDVNLAVPVIRGDWGRASLSLGVAAAFCLGILAFTVGIASWLQCRSLSLVAQILHWHRFSGFHHRPLGLLGADPRC